MIAGRGVPPPSAGWAGGFERIPSRSPLARLLLDAGWSLRGAPVVEVPRRALLDAFYRPQHLAAGVPTKGDDDMLDNVHAAHPMRWQRRNRWLAGIGGALGALVLGVVIALVVTRAFVGGGGSFDPQEAAPLEITAITVQGASGNGAPDFSCTASAAGGVGTVNFDNAGPNSACSLRVTVTHPRGADFGLKISDVRWVPQYINGWFAATGTGVTATCGTALGNGTSHVVGLQLQARDDVPVAGATFTADPDLDGIYASDVATGCPTAPPA